MRVVTRTIEQRGVILPWERVERYGPQEGMWEDRSPKGTVESGEVFIPLELMEEVAERTTDDYLVGNVPTWNLDYHQQLALVKAGLAEEETRGSIHGTDELRDFLRGMYE